MFSSAPRSLAIGATCLLLFSSHGLALDCPRGGISNTTAVRKTFPVPPISIYPLVGDFFDTRWSTLFSFNYTGETHPRPPANASESDPPPTPNAKRVLVWDGYQFEEQLIYIDDSNPAHMFNLRWNLTNPPVTKEYVPLTIDGYVQDFKFTSTCNDEASLLEWTVEYCSSDQQAAWSLFQNKTTLETNNLAMALNVTGAENGTWDVGCALTTTTTSAEPTSTETSGSQTSTSSTTTTRATGTSQNAAMGMVTAMPYAGGALALAVAAAAAAF